MCVKGSAHDHIESGIQGTQSLAGGAGGAVAPGRPPRRRMACIRILEQVAMLNPDLVLMDLAMPGMNGLETTRQIKARPAAPRVVIMTLYDVAEYRAAARDATADGFIAKSSIRSQLLPLLASLFPNP